MINSIRRFVRELRKPRPASPRSFQRSLDILARGHLKAANAARDDGRHEEAAELYAAYLRIRPDDAPIHVQQGNMLGSIGYLAGAESAFRAALRIHPSADSWLQLGRVLARQNRTAEAVDALVSALQHDPEMAAVHEALVAVGARVLVPRRRDQPGSLLADPAQASGKGVRGGYPSAMDSVYPTEAYDRFRKDLIVVSPPAVSEEPVLVLIDALQESPARLRATLVSLLDQDHAAWEAVILTTADMLQHPVASLGRSDARIAFHLAGGAKLQGRAPSIVSISAGTVLDPEALSWLVYARSRSGVSAVYADHDHRIEHWRDGPTFVDPVLHPMPDAEDLRTTWRPPEVIILDEAAASLLLDRINGKTTKPGAGAQARREVLLACVEKASTAHLPKIVASVADLPAIADRARVADEEMRSGWLEHEPCSPPSSSGPSTTAQQITVVIPTRDEAALLETCVQSLLATAAYPGRVSVVIADNRSQEPATAVLLSQLAAGGVEIMLVDEPFNWSRINNLAARDRRDSVLVFLNNDTQMLTRNWDEILCGHLQRGAGVLGARLLYPDQTIQHAGMIFGMADGPPMHEGVEARSTEGGPAGRWRRSRAASAVTGAFLAVSTDVFRQVGGFEERTMAVGYSDVDFCLKVRRAGRSVIYAADIELVHYESRSRGRNETRGRVAWDQGELTSLRKRWGAALDLDPGYNPAWARRSMTPFRAFSAPTTAEVLRWLDLSAAARPWALPDR